MQIEPEKFEAWLLSQPDERSFVYSNIYGECAACSFIRETTSHAGAWGGSDFGIRVKNDLIRLPEWLKCGPDGVLSVRPLTIGNMKTRFYQLFPGLRPDETPVGVTDPATVLGKSLKQTGSGPAKLENKPC